MVSNEKLPQGTSISETYGRPVTVSDIEDLLDRERVPRGTAARVLAAVRSALTWEAAKRTRPWDFTQGGLTQQEAERTAARRARMAEDLRREAELKKIAREPQLAEVIELPVVPGQTIADVVAEYAAATQPEPALPGPEPVPAAPEPEPALVTPERIFTCRTCLLELPEAIFNRDRTRTSGRESQCRDCKARIRQERKEAPAARSAPQALPAPAAAPATQAPAVSTQHAAKGSPGPVLPLPCKHCNACGLEKPHDAFRRNPTASDGRRGRCKECETGGRGERPAAPEVREMLPHVRECRRCRLERRVPDDFYQRADGRIPRTCRECEKEQKRNRERRARS